MNPEVTYVENLLQYIRQGGKLANVVLSYPPHQQLDVRYDKVTVGYHYMPWLHHPQFLKLYKMAETIEGGSYNGMSVAPRAYVILKMAESALGLAEGDFVECGVYKGGTALLAAEAVMRSGQQDKTLFHLFDTFEGIPEDKLDESEKAAGRAGELKDTSLEGVQRSLAAYTGFARYHPGFVPDTFTGFAPVKVRYLHIDINTRHAHQACMEFFFPMLVEGAVVVFDDYGWPQYTECKQAIDQYLRAHDLPLPTPLMTGQAIYTHRVAGKALFDF